MNTSTRYAWVWLFFGWVVFAAPQDTDDWDFTRDDFESLNDELGYADDSDWFPEKLKENLLATLVWSLDAGRNPTVTDGVNVRDFYHGHIVCKKPCDRELMDAVRTFSNQSEKLMADGLDGRFDNEENAKWFDRVTDENLDAFTQAMQEVERLATALIELACQQRDAECGVIYHTYEEHRPAGMTHKDSRRNIMTDFADQEPGPFTVPDPPVGERDRSASNYQYEYCHILQFAFLIDEGGQIHVTVGSTRQLSRVTGQPMR